VLAGANRVDELGQPGLEPTHGSALERGEGGAQRDDGGVIPLAQLGAELEEPGEPVRALERLVALPLEVAHLGGHSFGVRLAARAVRAFAANGASG